MKAIRISPYSCKYSKKIYTQYELLVLILFKDYRNQHYREFIEDIEDMESIQKELDLFPGAPFHNASEILQPDKNLVPSLCVPKDPESGLL